MTNSMGVLIDGIVAILLVMTIGYCILLNRRLKLLKADEQSLRATISELVTATEIAERAIGGLKLTVHECDMGLGERLRKAERMSIEIDRAVTGGKEVLARLAQIVSAGRPAEAAPRAEPLPAVAAVAANNDGNVPAKTAEKSIAKAEIKSGAKAVAAAAEAFAERLRNKVHGIAA